ncbi:MULTISPECIES: nucleoside recognition protein [unclassified Sulfurospirillum]|uniref:nucleoside recognition protein n=1 Tax=unclassified Sulfurospirillum TaxID=2618290 RepID=UPI0005082E9A|nr:MULTISPECIES: nucleoside recognition protein [unclassified Sulfurospirillum]KFL33881.1 nucleoside recognition protein [Sulfurospirillum sp. SCADC]
MSFSVQKSLRTSLKSSWTILKLIVPIYILADVLFYYNLLSHITFIFKPLVSLLGLPQEAALAIVSGLFLNLYAAIAFAAPLGLDAKEWTILAVFLGIAHALIVETEIMKRLGLSRIYSILLRLSVGLLVGGLTSKLPQSWFSSEILQEAVTPEHPVYQSLFSLVQNSLYESLSLSLKVIVLVTLLIFFLDFIKSLTIIEKHSQKVNSGFSITVGVILGITYGAGILISEYEKGILKKKEILFIGTYLMIAHAIIEDTLLFVIFGANPWLIVGLRLLFATLIATLVIRYSKAT